MGKPVIAIDCDDVIIGTAPNIINHYNETYGTTIDLKNYYSVDDIVWGVDSKTAIARVNEYLESPEHQKLEPFREAIEVAAELATRYELHVVTGRHDMLAQATSDMLHSHFPGIFGSSSILTFFLTLHGQKPTYVYS